MTTRPVRVAMVVNRFPTVSETFIFNKAAGLADCGVDVTVIAQAPSSDGDFYQGRLKELRLRRRCLRGFLAVLYGLADLAHLLVREPRRALRWLTMAIRGPRRGGASRVVLLGALAARRHDIVHFEFSGIGVAYLPVLDLLKPARIFVSCRGAAEQITPLIDPGRRSDLERLIRRADRVHCVSQDMVDCCKKYGLTEDKTFINRPAVRVNDFTRASPSSDPQIGLDSDPVRICSTGRLHWKKGFDTALLAIKLLKSAGNPIVYDIIGDGPEREKLTYMIETLGLSDTVTLRGRLSSSEVMKQLNNCQIFLMPSVSEGISNAALEAMAMERPVISTRSGGMDELITDGHNGLLVDLYAPEQIARSIRRLAEDVRLREQLGTNARQTVLERFSIERQMSVFASEYGSAV